MSLPAEPSRGERGSAFVAVLLVLVVLTILGLSLVLFTQTEVQLGSNERTINRTFFAAESGIAVSAARALTIREYEPFTYLQNETTVGGGDQRMADEIQVTLLAPLVKEPCDWCPRNANGAKFFKINHAVAVSARRVGWEGDDSSKPEEDPGMQTLSETRLSTMYEFQPALDPPPQSIDNKEEISRIGEVQYGKQ
ncbi:MAG TPA: PilX N-terminal domain-containing pilus assembly protein [Thermoanaerobaculia bacterium]|nr:PilX N-terminal domain-containing pilus assembly protein [Thermoanaerobaculia bacterium]